MLGARVAERLARARPTAPSARASGHRAELCDRLGDAVWTDLAVCQVDVAGEVWWGPGRRLDLR
eukprot:11285663-Alexandrium_andersonii.AAC.1